MKNQKGFTHWVIVILISVMAVGLVGVAWYYEENKEEDKINTNTIATNINTPVTTNTNVNQVRCEQLENEIKTLIEKVQYCDQDSDCIVDTSFQPHCPFGCYLIRNKSFDGSGDLSSIFKKMDTYYSNCPKCVYGCPMSPEQKDIKCQNNKCIDTRF